MLKELRTAQTTNNAGIAGTGTLRVNVISSIGQIPIQGATVTIFYTGEPDTVLEELTTDNSGLTETISLATPPIGLSLNPESLIQPYSEYNLLVTAPGFEPVSVTGSELLSDTFSFQPIRMNPLEITENEEKNVIIPAHTLWGEYPPKIPEAEVKPIAETGEIVLSRVVVPEYVIVQSENLAVSLTSLRVQMKNRKAEEQTEMDQVI